jgi:hypothetical protein
MAGCSVRWFVPSKACAPPTTDDADARLTSVALRRTVGSRQARPEAAVAATTAPAGTGSRRRADGRDRILRGRHAGVAEPRPLRRAGVRRWLRERAARGSLAPIAIVILLGVCGPAWAAPLEVERTFSKGEFAAVLFEQISGVSCPDGSTGQRYISGSIGVSNNVTNADGTHVATTLSRCSPCQATRARASSST